MSLINLIAIVIGWASQPAATESEAFLSEMRGQAIAANRCATCHSIGRAGESPDREAPPFRAFAVTAPLVFEDPEINRLMTRGHPVMPDFEMSDQERADITAYVRSLERPVDDFY